MKIFTKEWVKDIEFHDLILMLEKNTGIRIPFIFINGGTECVAKEDLYTVKTNLNVTDKENEIKFFTKGSSDYIIWIVVVLLLALGLIMVLSASSATALSESGDSYKYFKKQLISGIIGIIRNDCTFKN